ncbi:unnamed protein product [Rhizophagus irregularis]|nr:unnamed protein product [Rhizophagus irregularis]
MIEISQHLAQLCDKALIAEEHRLEANQEEILCWYYYGRNFVFQLEALCDNNKIGEKKARGLIYDEVVKQVNILRKKRSQNTGVPLPDITRDDLRKKTQRAGKIYKLLEKIGLDKIQYIKSYRDQVSESIAPIPLAHISNSSDDSKEVSPSNSLEAEDDYYKMLLEDCVYFDSTPKPVKETNEEVVSQSVKTDDDSNCNRNSDVCLKQSMPDDSDDDGYNGYGGYNEYGERDRGYYCCDGRYERKVSPMMSPIISPVTA